MITAEEARKLFNMKKALKEFINCTNRCIKDYAKIGDEEYRSNFITPKLLKYSKNIIDYYKNLHYKVSLETEYGHTRINISWKE